MGKRHLSGGEKKWVAIARAVLKDVPILVFDDATSSLGGRPDSLNSCTKPKFDRSLSKFPGEMFQFVLIQN